MRDVIIACDFSSKEQTLAFLDKFTGRKPFVKIGMELFYACAGVGYRYFEMEDYENAMAS